VGTCIGVVGGRYVAVSFVSGNIFKIVSNMVLCLLVYCSLSCSPDLVSL
jgi:F0F1-type ATP synthase assembly protein I